MFKRSLLAVLLTMMIICNWTGLTYADEQTSSAPVFNEKVMLQLRSSGYAWGDLVQGSVLTYRYQIPLETVLYLKSTEEDWGKAEEGLKAWNTAGKMLLQQTEPSQEILALQEEGFSEQEIAYIVFQNALKKQELSETVWNYRSDRSSLPGRNGLDFKLTRVYRSERAEMQKAGYRARMIDDEFFESNTLEGSNSMNQYHLGVGWGFDLPWVQVRYNQYDELEPRYLYLTSEHTYSADLNNPTGLKSIIKKYKFGMCSSYHYSKPANAVFFLKHISGVTHFFNGKGRLIQTQNQYGDMIRYEWDSGSKLIKVTDTVNRVISFSYTPTQVTVTVSGTPAPYQIRYYKRQITEHTATCQYELYQVDLPEETRVRYTYALEEAVFNYRSDGIGSLTNYYLNLKTRSNPCQGIANYNYTSYSRSKTPRI